MKVAVTGSFNPITLGHLDVIKRASKLFSEVVVVVLVNPEKEQSISLENRKKLIELTIANIKNAKADYYEGYLVDYCRINSINYIIRGVRNEKDFEYEKLMAEYNKINGDIDTLLLISKDELKEISSSKIKEMRENELVNILPKEIISEYLKLKDNYK